MAAGWPDKKSYKKEVELWTCDIQQIRKVSKDDDGRIAEGLLIDNLFAPDEVPMTYSDIDRSITGSAVPVKGTLKLLAQKRNGG